MPETALYIGEAGKYLSNGTALIPGVTVANVPDAEARASDLWSPFDAPSDAAPPSIIDGGAIAVNPTTGEPVEGTPVGSLDAGAP